MDKQLLNEVEEFYSKPLYEYNLSEEFSQDEIDQLAADAIEGADKEDIEKLRKGELKESLVTATIIAMPALLKLAGKITNGLYRKFGLSKSESEEYKTLNQKIKDLNKEKPDNYKEKIKGINNQIEKKFGSKIGDSLVKGGKSLHKLYTAPIRGLLYVLSLAANKGSKLKDKKFREKVANIIYAGAMIYVAGTGIYDTLSHLHGVSDVATIAVEGIEEQASIAEIIAELFESAGVTGELEGTAAASDIADAFQDN
jgi:hypothetical protein